MDAVDSFWNGVATKVDEDYIDQSLTDNKIHIASLFPGLLHMLEKKFCHGDLKPQNILWDPDQRIYRISDFGSCRIIKDVYKLMNKNFRFKSEREKTELAPVIRAILNNNEAQIANFKQKFPERFDRLRRMKVLTGDRLEAIASYIPTTFLPGTTPGYACRKYLGVMCDAFWQGDKKLFAAACNALDMRAFALIAYRILTSNPTPLENEENDTAYYDRLESALRAQDIGKEAANILRRMAEPRVDEKFTLPVSIKEVKKLTEILRKF